MIIKAPQQAEKEELNMKFISEGLIFTDYSNLEGAHFDRVMGIIFFGGFN